MREVAVLWRHEMRALARGTGARVVLVLLAVLLCYGTTRGEHAAKVRSADQQSARVAIERIRATSRGAYALGMAGTVATLTPRDAAALSIGQADLRPDTHVVTLTTSTKRRSDRYELQSPLLLASGALDLAFVIVHIVPLAVLALSLSLVGEERDGGTLGLMLAHGVSVPMLIGAKCLARLCAIGVLVVSVPLATLWLLHSQTSPASYALYSCIALAYTSLWLALASAATVFLLDTARCALALLVCWLASTLLIPAAVSALVAFTFPPASPFALVEALRSDAVRDLDGEKLLARWHGEHPELGEQHDAEDDHAWQVQFALVQGETMRRARPIELAHAEAYERQQRLVSVLRYLSPSAVAHEALDSIAGTDAARYQRFRQAVEAWAPSWNAWFTERLLIARGEEQPDASAAQPPRYPHTDDVGPGGVVLAALCCFATWVGLCVGVVVWRERRATALTYMTVTA